MTLKVCHFRAPCNQVDPGWNLTFEFESVSLDTTTANTVTLPIKGRYLLVNGTNFDIQDNYVVPDPTGETNGT